MKKFQIFILLFIFVNSLFTLEADSLKTKMRHYNLEGIRIIADRPQETIGTVEVIEFDPVISLPETNIAKTVEKINGLHVSTGGKSGSTLRIRGFENDQIKIMLDGRPLSGGYFGNVDLNTIPISDIKEIRGLKGPVSSLYGSDTMGGVINIITDSPTNTSWLKMGTVFKRNNTNKSYVSSARNLGEWDYWLYASHFQTDGFMLSTDFIPTNYEDGDVRDNCERNQWDLQSKLNFTIFDFHSIGFQVGYSFMSTKEIPRKIYDVDNNNLREFIDWKRYQLSALGSFHLRYNLTSDTNIYYDRYDDTYAEFNPYTGDMYLQWPSNIKSWILGAHQKFDWEITDNLDSSFGYRFERESYIRKDNGTYPEWSGNDQLKHNGFWQAEFNYYSLNLTVGSGVSFFKQNGRGNWISHFEPSTGLYYKNSHNWKSSLAFSSNTKYPTMHQLFSSSSGNSDITEERAQKSEFNLLVPYSFGTFSGSIQQSVFYNHITGLIEKLGGTYSNIDQVDSYGYEVSSKVYFVWEHQADYSYIKYSDDSNMELLETPSHTVIFTERVELPYSIKMEYNTSWKDVRHTEESVVLPAYWLHSVYFNKKIKRYKIMFGIENIFDLNYEEEYGYPGEGITFVLSLEGEFF